MRKFLKILLTACAAGLVSFAFPRLLIAAGVPLDVWILKIGIWLGAAPDWVNVDTAVWLFTLILGFVLFGIESLLHPLQRFWRFVTGVNQTKAQPVISNLAEERGQIDPKPIETQRDMTACDAIDCIAELWPDDDNSLLKAGQQFRQAALDGRLKVWGYKPGHMPLESGHEIVFQEIPASYWADHYIDLAECMGGETGGKAFKEGLLENDLDQDPYERLRVSSQEINSLRRKLAPPGASFNVGLVERPVQIGDYDCICAVSVKNIESRELSSCLVQIEQISGTYPDQMPVPLVLRTQGQIDSSRQGRFTLSPSQPKTVPVLFRNRKRNNEWFFVDENGKTYFIPSQKLELVLGVYGGQSSGKELLNILVGDSWRADPSLLTVDDDFVLSKTKDNETS